MLVEAIQYTAGSIFCPIPSAAPPVHVSKHLQYKRLSHEALVNVSANRGFDCFAPPTSLSLCHSAGDYILETKPKEISEAQRLNYEQVRPAYHCRAL